MWVVLFSEGPLSEVLLSSTRAIVLVLLANKWGVFLSQWSYGVTCWEVFSGGKTPYPGIHPADLLQQLDKGVRMDKPLNAACTDEM